MDISQNFGSDIDLSQSGNLLLVDGTTLAQQRIVRRLLAAPGGYLFDLTYGAGLRSYVGQALSESLKKEIIGLIIGQMLLETAVSQTPPPQITLSSQLGNLFCNIIYTNSTTKTLETLNLTVTN